MKQEFKIFSHEMFGQIRTMTDEKGETFFVGNDVAKALGYKNTRDALNKHVDSDDKGVAKCDTLGGEQNLVFVNESGQFLLYADFARKGYARNRTHSHYDSEGELHTRTYLVWTERGRKFIHRVCKTEEIMIPFLLGVDVNIEEE